MSIIGERIYNYRGFIGGRGNLGPAKVFEIDSSCRGNGRMPASVGNVLVAVEQSE